MNPETGLKEMAELIFSAMNQRDFNTFEKVITDDIIFEFPGTAPAEGARRSLLLMRSILRKFPILHFNVIETLVDGDRACVSWTNEGENTTGEQYVNQGITLVHFRNGKICFLSDYFKDTAFATSQ